MKYLLVALTGLFVAMAYVPTANAAGCAGGVYNAHALRAPTTTWWFGAALRWSFAVR